MTCKCKEHKEEYTCSGNDCQVCVLDEENYIENPQSKKERYCLNCAMKKGGFTEQELWQLMMANPDTTLGCNSKSEK
ncbi:MAG: hypothetical protein HOK63_03445 [Thaumarchaeota archaeon]|jgi:hypothetical protein|nr:hypothetical protein [Nitrososphaerota archaeon]MBT6468691.1 hypothetical protein [Nitrososphaerota archaeon]